MSLPTLILTPLMALALLFALVSSARLLRGWVLSRESERVQRTHKEKVALLDAKERCLTTLRDLEFEHEMGKIGEADYVDLRRFYEQEAIRVMTELDQL